MSLRTGHNRLNAHVFNNITLGQSEMCLCITAPMTSRHPLQHCPLQETLRKTTCPEDPPLTEKLYGDLAALGRTAALICERSQCLRLAMVIDEEEDFCSVQLSSFRMKTVDISGLRKGHSMRSISSLGRFPAVA